MAAMQESYESDGLHSRIVVNLTPEEAREFVRALIEDPGFRERLLSGDPLEVQEALAERHVYVPEDVIPEEVTLPEPDEIREALARLEQEGEFRVTREWGFLLAPLAYSCFIAFAQMGEARQR